MPSIYHLNTYEVFDNRLSFELLDILQKETKCSHIQCARLISKYIRTYLDNSPAMSKCTYLNLIKK